MGWTAKEVLDLWQGQEKVSCPCHTSECPYAFVVFMRTAYSFITDCDENVSQHRTNIIMR